MPKLQLEVPHTLDQEEALRRLKKELAAARAMYGSHANKLEEEWTDHSLNFSLQAMGMSVSGTMAVEPQSVRLSVALPMAAMLFKRAIEDRVRQEIDRILR